MVRAQDAGGAETSLRLPSYIEATGRMRSSASQQEQSCARARRAKATAKWYPDALLIFGWAALSAVQRICRGCGVIEHEQAMSSNTLS